MNTHAILGNLKAGIGTFPLNDMPEVLLKEIVWTRTKLHVI